MKPYAAAGGHRVPEVWKGETKTMAKFTIVFHSVCGNTYQIEDCFYRVLQERGQEVALYRTADASFESGERRSDEFKHLQAAIDAVPVIEEAAQVLGSDVLLLGSPTYYGCVSAQMKTFMDSFEKMWADAPTAGMYFGCFTSAGDGCGGPELCLQVMNTFAQHMGMVPISVPCNIGGTAQPAYGIKHVSGEKADRAVTEETQTAVRNYADHILRVIS